MIAQKYKIITKYPDNLARLKVQNHLSYKLGQALLKAFKTWYKGGLFRLPFVVLGMNKNKK